ncbi:MAG TPA: hypothetical protein VK638_46985 [Edaphobacter sp.]|nr:hypothetical protein [Edaphobacter sp.]
MTIQAIRKTGFLVEDGSKFGTAVGYLQAQAAWDNNAELMEIARYLDSLRAENYYLKVPATEEIEVIA